MEQTDTVHYEFNPLKENPMNEKPALGNPEEFPDENVLRNILGENYVLFEQLMDSAGHDSLNLEPEWKYYKDGHSWLCKVQKKKKTVFWLSVFNGYFKVAFYFSAKLCEGIMDLEIDEAIKKQFEDASMIGKVKPLVIDMDHQQKLQDVLLVAGYKTKHL